VIYVPKRNNWDTPPQTNSHSIPALKSFASPVHCCQWINNCSTDTSLVYADGDERALRGHTVMRSAAGTWRHKVDYKVVFLIVCSCFRLAKRRVLRPMNSENIHGSVAAVWLHERTPRTDGFWRGQRSRSVILSWFCLQWCYKKETMWRTEPINSALGPQHC